VVSRHVFLKVECSAFQYRL